MDACKLDYTGFDTFSLPIKHSSSLTSLTINKCFLDVELLESLLSRTPALVHLKLISRNRAFDSIFDGYNWEQFICAKLPKLDEFQFFFSFIEETMDYFGILNSIITSFQTLFWLYDQQWFTTSAYDFQSSTFELQTTTIRTVGPTNSIKFAVSALDGTYHFIGPTQQANESNTLTTLSLRQNRIGDIGAEYLAILLRNNPTLKELDLSLNRITNHGAQNIALGLQQNKVLTRMNLSQNQIEDDGARQLVEILHDNQTLINLELHNNPISTKIQCHLKEKDLRIAFK
ncbi:unnamed protein product [Rotaria sp. Silwood1]|nr:unnamed protein product [Rotaria sp. Silwood1]CAF3769081.1 unnamed protein product [Rotaria sp. Silwood1]CAF3846260.1 unnamed protein product [Rotaria sp. Silwood1]